MAYRKRFEDSYLDEEIDEFSDGDGRDCDKVVSLIKKHNRTNEGLKRIKQLTTRLENGARFPGQAGRDSIDGLKLVADAYIGENMKDEALVVLASISEIAAEFGVKELYYYAVDKIEELS